MVATSSPLIAGLTRRVRAVAAGDVAEQKSRNVENMDAEIFDDETLAFREIGLAAENVKGRAKRHPAPEGLADRAHF